MSKIDFVKVIHIFNRYIRCPYCRKCFNVGYDTSNVMCNVCDKIFNTGCYKNGSHTSSFYYPKVRIFRNNKAKELYNKESYIKKHGLYSNNKIRKIEDILIHNHKIFSGIIYDYFPSCYLECLCPKCSGIQNIDEIFNKIGKMIKL